MDRALKKEDRKMKVRKIKVKWDITDPGNEGWYAECQNADNETIDDSMKPSFPVNVDDFDENAHEELLLELQKAFPGKQIVFSCAYSVTICVPAGSQLHHRPGSPGQKGTSC